MDKLRPRDASRFKSGLTAGILFFAGAAAVPAIADSLKPSRSGPSYTDRIAGEIERTGPLTEGDIHVGNVRIDGITDKLDAQIDANGGAYVRTLPNSEDGNVIAKLPAGAVIYDAILTSGDGGEWVAAKCDTLPISDADRVNVIGWDRNGQAVIPEVCFIKGDLTNASEK
jgi:hypothetical protein